MLIPNPCALRLRPLNIFLNATDVYRQQIMAKNDTFLNYIPNEICLDMRSDKLSGFFPLLQSGFKMKAEVGCNLKTFLCSGLGMTPNYIEEKINTIILDGKAVDDPDSAILNDGSILALSAAMPGLVGATLRRGGYLAPLRSQITYRQADGLSQPGKGMISLKLFNTLIKDLGTVLLKIGVYLSGDELSDILDGFSRELWVGCKGATVNDRPVDLNKLLGMTCLDESSLIELRVQFGG